MEKKLLLLLVFITTSICGWSWEDAVKPDFMVDNFYYRFNADHQSVAVTYNFLYYPTALHQISDTYSGDVTIPETVTYNDVIYPVTKIDKYAFYHCLQLTSVTIPSSITEIGDHSFGLCYGLTQVNLPNSITSIGERAFVSCSVLTTINIPLLLTKIEDGCFASCSSLPTISLPEGIVSIGDNAFYNCTTLTTALLPNSLETIGESSFRYCSKLQNITLPEHINKIGNDAFSNCFGLKSITVLCNLGEFDSDKGEFVNIGNQDNGIFNKCGEIDVYLNNISNGIALIMTGAFNVRGLQEYTSPRFLLNNNIITEIVIPDGFTNVPSFSFVKIRNLKKVTFPSSMKTIGDCAFSGCSDLESLSFPEALETIGNYAFGYCTNLETITFGKSIKTVGTRAFEDCTKISKVEIGDLANWCNIVFDPQNDRANYPVESQTSNPLSIARKIYLNGKQLQSLKIPSGVKSIGVMAFAGCCKFIDLEIPNTLESIGELAFYGCSDMETIKFGSAIESIGTKAFQKCIGLTTVSLPNTITSIGSEAFRGCTNITTFKLPNQITEISPGLFYDCTKLASVIIPETVTRIGSSSFRNCSGLTRIDIPTSVQYIGTEAFYGCNGLTGVYIKDMEAWCGIQYGNNQDSPNYEPEDKRSNPLIWAHNLYLNNELVTNLVVPEGVKAIGRFAFWGAECLESVQLPNGLEKIGRKAFCRCYNLSSINIPSSVISIEDAFEWAHYYRTDNFKLYLDDLGPWLANNLGRGIENLGRGIVGAGVELYVKNERIYNLVIPKAITTLNECDFAWMILNSVTFHSDLESINGIPFHYTNVKFIYSKAKFAPEGTMYNLRYSSSTLPLIAIYVPKGRSSNYKSKWVDYADIIKEADTDVTGSPSASSISELKSAINAVQGTMTYLNLTEATLDESVTAESLKAGDTNSNIIYYLPDNTNITGDNIVVNGVAENVNLIEGNPIEIPEEFVATNVTYSRSLPKSNSDAYTLCLPYDLSLPAGLKAYTLREKNSYGQLVFVETDGIIANKPYLIVAESTVNNLNAQNVTMKVTPETMDDEGTSDFEFRGTLMTIGNEDAAAMGAYILQANKEWHPVKTENPNAFIAAGRAYLIPKTNGVRNFYSSSFTNDNEITAIKTISKNGSEEYYDLRGHRIDNPTNGVYIVNRKKINVK